ncbi:MAG: hypothetical protein WC000_11315, partial [Dokdonella sp.]
MAGENPYEALIQTDLEGEQARDSQFKATTSLALDANPDAVAKTRRDAAYLGVPPAAAEALPEDTRRRAALQQIDEHTADAPTLRQRYTQADFARLAHDDSGVLSGIESVVRKMINGGPTRIERPTPSVMSGAEYSKAVRQQIGRGLDPDTARALALQGTTIDNGPLIGQSRGPAPSVGSVLGGIFNTERFRAADAAASIAAADLLGLDNASAVRAYQKASNRARLADPEFDTSTGQGLYSGGVSLVQNAPGLALSILTGNPAPGLAMMGAQVGADSYGKYRERGATAGEAAVGGLLEGGIEIATEALPMGFLVNRLGKAGASEFLRGWLAREMPTEQLATFAQDAVDTAIANPDKSWGQFFAERPEAAYQTLLATLVQSGAMGALNVAATKVLPERAAAARAEETGGTLEQLVTLMAESKLRERAPDSFNDFVAQITESGGTPTELYIDAEQLANTLNQGAITLEQLRAFAPAAADQLEAAQHVPGADIRVPLAEFAAAPQEITAALLDHLRESPDAMSRDEAKQYLSGQGADLLRQVQQELDAAAPAAEFQQSVAEISAQFEAQLNAVGKFRPEANRAYAGLLGNFYAVQAQRAGVSAQEFMQRYRLGVTAKEAQGEQQLEQGAITTTPEFRKWFAASAAVDDNGKPKVVYHGTRGDFDAFDRDQAGKTTGAGNAKLGFFFTDRADVAARYARMGSDQQGQQSILPVYVSMQNPVRVAAKNMQEADKKLEVEMRPKHDGAIISVGEGDSAQTVYVVREPTQIKSAIGNDGSYDASDPNILSQGNRAALSFGADITASPSVIALLENADLSSFIHESGHFFLEVLADLAARIQGGIAAGESVSDSERAIVADMEKILTWFGVKATPEQSALEVWLTMTLEQKRHHHEQWARGFEKYVMEGKAPSQELQSLFSKFRAWLVSVYKTLAGLNVQLSDEVRQVMGRMLATDEAIAQAEAARAMGPLFQSPEQSGMTPQQYADYQALAERQTSAASAELDARLMKDMKWLSRARDKAIKARQAEVEDLRREVTREIRAEVMSQPVYRAWAFLTGKSVRAEPGVQAAETIDPVRQSGRLRTSLVKELYPDLWKTLSERHMTAEQTGMDPDIAAEVIEGFSSGDEMVKALATAPAPQAVIEELTDRQMLERFGDIASDEAMAQAADEAVHNEIRARVIATELKALEKAGTVRAGKRSTIDVMARAAKDYAYAIIAGQRVRDLRPGQYSAAQARSAKLAAQALGKSTEEAALHKRNELINSYAAKAAYDAQAEVKALQTYFRKFDKRSKGIDPGYQDQIEQLLEQYDFKPASLKEVDKRKSFAAWYAEQQEAGNPPNVPPELLEAAGRRSYKDMTVEELRGLRDTIKQIEHQGRLKNKLLLARDKRDFDAIALEMAASIIEHGGKPRPVDLEGPNPVMDWFAGAAASHRKLSSLFRQMDGNNDA